MITLRVEEARVIVAALKLALKSFEFFNEGMSIEEQELVAKVFERISKDLNGRMNDNV